MQICIVGRGMEFGPHTLGSSDSLGGSETAQICVGEALADLGHDVTQFCRLRGQPTTWRGVHWRHVDELASLRLKCDLMIVCRRPDIIERDHHFARAKVLWIQDFAAPDHGYPNVDALFSFDEIWAVSHWQRDQWLDELLPIIKAPRERIPMWVTRNGIAPQNLRCSDVRIGPRNPRKLAFVSRPERGLPELVRPGGIMDHMEGYHLHVCGYDDYPAANVEFYRQCNQWMRDNPRVSDMGPLANVQVRALVATSAALMLPTNYPETSCMAALEAISVLTPVIHTTADFHVPRRRVGAGALPETVRDAGCMIKVYDAEFGTDGWCRSFARQAIRFLEREDEVHGARMAALRNTSFNWSDIAREWTERAERKLTDGEWTL